MNLAVALRGTLVMIVLGTGLGLAQNALSPDPLPWKPVPKTTIPLEDLVPDDPGEPVVDLGAGTGIPETAAAVTANGSSATEETVVAPKASDPPPDGTPPAEVEDPVGNATADEIHDGEAAAIEDQADETTGGQNGDREPAAAETADAYADIPEAQFPFEVSLGRAKSLYDRGGLLVLDAREHHEFAEGHIQGAESAPFDIMVGEIEWLDRTAADPRPLLVYCDGTDCEVSLNLGFELSQAGHGRVLILTGGYRAWADAGHPTAAGEQP